MHVYALFDKQMTIMPEDFIYKVVDSKMSEEECAKLTCRNCE